MLKICVLPEPVLRQKAKRVTTIDNSIQRLIDDMVETMRAASGIGLAAPQVGIPLRIAVIEMPGEELMTLINPEIVKREGERVVTEACLSVPGYEGEIKRSLRVKVKARDKHGKEFRIGGDELLAQVLEHEIDHLDGTLYVDYIESPEKLERVVPTPNEPNTPPR